MTLTEIVKKIEEYLRGSGSLRQLSSELLEYPFPEDEVGSASAFLVGEVLAASIDHFEQGLPEEYSKARILMARSLVVPVTVTFGEAEPSLSGLHTWANTRTTPEFVPSR